MGEIKIGIYILQTMGFITWIGGILANLDNVKSAVLFFAGLVFASYKIANERIEYLKKREDFRELQDQRKEKKLHDIEMKKKL